MTGFLCNTYWHWHNKPVAGKKKALPKQFGNVGQICKTSGPKSYFPLRYPNKKAHLAPCFTANLPFGGNIAHPTPSVFHADQHGGGTFLIPTLWPQFWGPSSSPWGSPTSARPGTDFRACFIKNTLLGIIKLVIWNFFLTLPDIWVRFWSHPQPHGEPQHQQGQELTLELLL